MFTLMNLNTHKKISHRNCFYSCIYTLISFTNKMLLTKILLLFKKCYSFKKIYKFLEDLQKGKKVFFLNLTTYCFLCISYHRGGKYVTRAQVITYDNLTDMQSM